jgi:hypothetical protein
MSGDASLKQREMLATHAAVLAAIVLGTLVLWLWPAAVLSLPLACVTRTWLHLQCPFCGMTRDFAAMLHGQRPTHNLFSPIMALLIYVAYPLAVLVLWRRRSLQMFYGPVVIRAVVCSLIVMFAVNNFR